MDGDRADTDTALYFAYGSNMDARRMAERGVAYTSAEAAVLDGYRLAFNKRSGRDPGTAAANVMPAPGARVEGVLYRLRDAAALARLDQHEDYPRGYTRDRLPVRGTGGESCSAWVYLATPAFVDEGLLPRREYLAHLLAAGNLLSARYLARLASVACIDDATEAGRLGGSEQR